MAARTALSFLKGRLPTIGRVCTRSSAANIAARLIIEPRPFIRETETETVIEKALRKGLCFDTREELNRWRVNAHYKIVEPDAGNAFIKHSVLENLNKKEASLSNNDKCILYVGRCNLDHPISLSKDRPGKSWFSVLSLDDDGKVLPKYDIAPPYPLCTYRCYNICNGVFCFVGFVNNEGDDHDVYLYHLWNPATNEVKTLPEAPDHAILYSDRVCFDDKSQDYKVLRFFHDTRNHHGDGWNLDFELYSLKTDSWKKISCAEFCDGSRFDVLINGVYYTTAYRKQGSSEEVILAFDISTETISYIPLHGIIEKKAFCLLDYKGMLSILSFVPDGTYTTDYEHWVMSNGSWLKLSVFHTCNVGCPLCFSRNGELLFFRSLNDIEVLVFDSTTGMLKHLDANGYGIYNVFPFSETFMKLGGVSELEFTRRIMNMREKNQVVFHPEIELLLKPLMV